LGLMKRKNRSTAVPLRFATTLGEIGEQTFAVVELFD